MRKNKFASITVDGKLEAWKGPNPDTGPTAVQQAIDRSGRFLKEGKTAIPVVVKETKRAGRPREDDRDKKVVSTYLPEEVLEKIKLEAVQAGSSVSSTISSIIEKAMKEASNETEP
jgi:hypothetical protein